MRYEFAAQLGGQLKQIAWLSLQPDLSVSFGLRDRTFVTPKTQYKCNVWSAYNQRRRSFRADQFDCSISVKNPHFTYHPNDHRLHLTANQGSYEERYLFEAISDLPFTLKQTPRLPWVRAVSAPIESLRTPGPSRVGVEYRQVVLPTYNNRASVFVSVDFLAPGKSMVPQALASVYKVWGQIALYCEMGFSYPSEPSLTWCHFS